MSKIFFRTWHRRLGVVSVLMVLWLSFSGILINHGDGLSLNKRTINSEVINKLYGLEESQTFPKGFYIENDFFFCHQKSLYRNAEEIGICGNTVKSFQTLGNDLLLLSDTGIALLTNSFEFVEYLEFSSMFDHVQIDQKLNEINIDELNIDELWKTQSILGEQEVLVVSVNANSLLKPLYFSIDLLSLEIHAIQELPIDIAKPEAIRFKSLPKEFRDVLDFPGITLERLLLDAHSGRLFGGFGIFIVDFFAVAFVVLGMSGIWIFIKRS